MNNGMSSMGHRFLLFLMLIAFPGFAPSAHAKLFDKLKGCVGLFAAGGTDAVRIATKTLWLAARKSSREAPVGLKVVTAAPLSALPRLAAQIFENNQFGLVR